jgi:hypothetical protein
MAAIDADHDKSDVGGLGGGVANNDISSVRFANGFD